MKDFTKDSIVKHIVTMAAPIALSMISHIAYQLVDLYFVTKLGVAATAGVNAAGTATFMVNGLTQVLIVGTVSLVAHAVGRKDRADANLIFNQSMILSIVVGVIIVGLLYMFTYPYLRSVAADPATVEAGAGFIVWMLPGFALSLAMGVFSSALRGIGIVQPSVAAYMLTVIANAILAPFLIVGWGTGMALGAKGAGLATSISVAIGVLFLAVCFHRLQGEMEITPKLLRPRFREWRRILAIGLPAGAELVLMFLSTAVVYYTIRDLGASAQAGFGIGSRVLQAILLPAMVISVAAGPIAGQNFGAKNWERVKGTFRSATLLGTVLMTAATVLVQWRPTALVVLFDADAGTMAIAALFLQLVSWTFVAQSLVFTCSSLFQGLGNTVPSLISSGSRFAAFSVPAVWISMQPEFRIEHLWYLWIVAAILQAMVSLWLLRLEFRRRLPAITSGAAIALRKSAVAGLSSRRQPT